MLRLRSPLKNLARFTLVAMFFATVDVAWVHAQSGEIGSIVNRTILPIEFQTPFIQCGKQALLEEVNNTTQAKATPAFFMGKYRVFGIDNTNSDDIATGLNFILAEKSPCTSNTYNTISITKMDWASNTITVVHSASERKNFGTNQNRACRWSTLIGRRESSPPTVLKCKVVPRPTLFGAPAIMLGSMILHGNVSSDRDSRIASYFSEFEDISLPSRSAKNGEAVRIASYLVCRDTSKKHMMAFAVMQTKVDDPEYSCR